MMSEQDVNAKNYGQCKVITSTNQRLGQMERGRKCR